MGSETVLGRARGATTSQTRAGVPLLAVAHGTQDAAGLAEIEALLDRVRASRPGLRVEVGYVDVARPSLDEALAALSGEVVLVPLLLGAGYHIKVDIPRALADAPQVRALTTPALGPDPLLADALADRLWESGGRIAGSDGAAVLLAAAGSTDPASNADAARVARMLARRLGVPVETSYVCGATPSVNDAVARLRAGGHRRIAVASYLLAPGFFARRIVSAGADHTGAPLGSHAAIARLVLRRYDEGCRHLVPGLGERLLGAQGNCPSPRCRRRARAEGPCTIPVPS